MNRFGAHTLVAVGVGGFVACIALVASWVAFADRWQFGTEQTFTRYRILGAVEAVRAYREKNGRLPVTLAELGQPVLTSYGTFSEADGWGRPLVYSVQGDGFGVVSLGRDGQPGGAGLDCDQTDVDPLPAESTPTLMQFVFASPTESLIGACLACGLLAALAALASMRARDVAGRGVLYVAVKLLLVTGISLVIAMVLGYFEIPTGH